MDRTTHPLKPVLGVSIAVWKAERVLLIKRGQEPFLDHWSFPGGRVEAGESLMQAAIREVKEETTVEITTPQFVRIIEIFDRNHVGVVSRHIVLALFAAAWEKGEAQAGSDASDLTWATEDELQNFQTTTGLVGYAKESRLLLHGRNWNM